jgi:hypothetical protein
MSTNNRIIVVIGLGIVVSLGWAVMPHAAAIADEPITPMPSQAAAPRPQEERYLLLSSGQLIHGIVTETESEYLVEQHVGVLRFAKRRAEGVFDSIREAYEFRLNQLPKGDFDEEMKLAFWCLNLKLTAEAKVLLSEIVEHNPNNKQAKAMLVSLDQAAARASVRQRDPDVRQARVGEGVETRPAPLDSAILGRALRGLGISDLPVIFDLPTPLAIKRSDEFYRYVHPLLQTRCARCHDGQYDGAFQLVPIKSRTDRTPDALRANLDATLRLVDPKAPSHSELLSSTLRPHGRGPRPRPIFPGSNDPTYKILAAWVNSLAASKAGNDVARADQGPTRINQAEAFAADRNHPNPDQLNLGGDVPAGAGMVPALPAGIPSERKIPPPSRIIRGGGSVPEVQNPGDPQEFPLPFVITGTKPNVASPGAKTKAAAKASSQANAASAASTQTGNSKVSKGSNAKAAVAEPDTAADDTNDQSATKVSKKPNKPLTIDPKLLERALMNRNSSRPKPPAE